MDLFNNILTTHDEMLLVPKEYARCNSDVEAEEMRVVSHLVSVKLADCGVKTLTFTSDLPLRPFFPVSRE
jgi:hypothetical protein